MRELKRVLFTPKLWGLLALLLAVELVLFVGQDTHMDGFYEAYCKALPAFSELPTESALTAAEKELEELKAVGLLRLWVSGDAEIRQALEAECAEAFGSDFETRIANGEFALDEAALQENYLRREVLQTMIDQLTHLRDYPAYLQQVQNNVDQMRALSIFRSENPFTLRNIEKTGRDFPTEVTLRLDNDFALTALVTDQLGGYCLLIFTLFLTLQFLQERKRGLWSLVHGAPNGRGTLAVKRMWLLLFGVTLGTVVLLGGKLLFCALRCGGLGGLSRNVQSAAVFSDFPWVMPVWAALTGYFVLKILGMWLVGMAVWAVLQSVNHLPLAIGAACVVLAAEYSLFRFIPDSYTVVIFRYVNLFALVDTPKVALHYLNIDLFGQPVQGFLLSMGLIVPLLAALLAGNCLLARYKKPVARQNSLLGLLDRLRVPFSKAVGRLRLFGLELYKLLWLQKGLIVLLALALFSFAVMEAPQPDSQMYDTEIAALSASLQGPITEDTLQFLDEKLAQYAAWEQNEAVLRQIEALERLREKVTASLTAGDGLWLIDQVPFAALMGGNVDNYQRRNAIVLLLAVVLLTAGVFAQETQSRMPQLLHGAPRGRGRLLRRKTAAALLLTLLVWAIFEAGELRLLHGSYEAVAYAAPLQSFDAFAELPYAVSLGVGTAVYLLLRLLALLAAASVMLFLSALCEQSNSAILFGCAVLVLPACLSYMGIDALDPLSITRALSPTEASAAGYIAAAVGTLGLNALTCLCLRKKRSI